MWGRGTWRATHLTFLVTLGHMERIRFLVAPKGRLWQTQKLLTQSVRGPSRPVGRAPRAGLGSAPPPPHLPATSTASRARTCRPLRARRLRARRRWRPLVGEESVPARKDPVPSRVTRQEMEVGREAGGSSMHSPAFFFFFFITQTGFLES